jgi:hypothetical protein
VVEMKVVVTDETGLVKRVEFGHAAETPAAVVKHRTQDRALAPVAIAFDRAGEAVERCVILGLTDGSIELLDLETSARTELLPAGTFAEPIVRMLASHTHTHSLSLSRALPPYHRLEWHDRAHTTPCDGGTSDTGSISCVWPRVRVRSGEGMGSKASSPMVLQGFPLSCPHCAAEPSGGGAPASP